MGIGLVLADLTEEFQMARYEPIILNYQGGEKFLDKNILTKYSTDVLSNTPSCECGATTDRRNIGRVCSSCGTIVEYPIDQEIEPRIWMKSPEGVSRLINPQFWSILTKYLTPGGFDILQWMTNRLYVGESNPPTYLEQIESIIGTRGYNNFVDNLIPIMEGLFTIKKLFNQEDVSSLRSMIHKYYPSCILCDYIPFPNKSMAVLEVNASGTYRDATFDKLFDAVNIIIGVDLDEKGYTVAQRERRVAKTLSTLAEFHDNYIKKIIQPKEGLVRKIILGSRMHFSFRAVITSITKPHECDEIHIPWTIGCVVLKMHLLNLLINRHGMIEKAAEKFINDHTYTYHPLLDSCFKAMIHEADNSLAYPYNKPGEKPGIMVTMVRNPSLHLGSNPLCRISIVKPDTNDPTVSIPINLTRGMNADEKIVH